MDDLISKKELLALYNISYGALYRWKRMGLIPESWFIRKSTSTGQETFFVRSLICERVETILGQKSEKSLTEIGDSIKKSKTPTLVIVLGDSEFTYELDSVSNIFVESDEKKFDLTNIIKEML